MVIRKPSISIFGLILRLTTCKVLNSLLIPSSAKYSHCTGMITESAAAKTDTVMSPKLGEQSIKIKS